MAITRSQNFSLFKSPFDHGWVRWGLQNWHRIYPHWNGHFTLTTLGSALINPGHCVRVIEIGSIHILVNILDKQWITPWSVGLLQCPWRTGLHGLGISIECDDASSRSSHTVYPRSRAESGHSCKEILQCDSELRILIGFDGKLCKVCVNIDT